MGAGCFFHMVWGELTVVGGCTVMCLLTGLSVNQAVFGGYSLRLKPFIGFVDLYKIASDILLLIIYLQTSRVG